MKNAEFHKPFIKNLSFIVLVTIVSMVSTRLFFPNLISGLFKTPSFASQKFHISTNK